MPGVALSLADREEISVALIGDREMSWAEIARRAGRHPSTIGRVIVATHNPNLPVNGDAELVCALTATSDGAVRSRGQVAALGSLDRSNVREQVELIMEGSKEAFKRRRAKYGF